MPSKDRVRKSKRKELKKLYCDNVKKVNKQVYKKIWKVETRVEMIEIKSNETRVMIYACCHTGGYLKIR